MGRSEQVSRPPRLRGVLFVLGLWFLGLFALSWIFYPQMLSQVPVFAGTMVEKSVFWAIRIQVINALTAGLLVLFLQSLAEDPDFSRLRSVSGVLVATLLLKSGYEFVLLFREDVLALSQVILLPTVILGVTVAGTLLAPLLKDRRYRALRFTPVQITVALVLGLVYAAMNLPVAFLGQGAGT